MSQGGNNKQAKRYHGLRNQGSTCYLNSVLQVLFMTEDFREAVGRCPNDLEDPIDHQLDALFENLKEGTGETYEVTQKLGIDNVNEQRDAAEHMEKILTMASQEASKIFEIRLNNKTICCGDCDEETDEEKSFWNLPLPLKQSSNESYSVNDAIKDFFKDSHFSEDNQLYCEKCDGKRDATIKCVINQHPEVLMLLLKRFEFNYYQMCFVKNTCKVDVPFIVHIPWNQTYELYAFVEHFGSLKSGHYTATIRSQDEDRWYNFNDSSVTKQNNRPFQGNKIEGSKSAYLLFYRKKGADQDNRKVPNKRDLLPDNNKNSSSCPDVNKSEKDENAKPNKDEGSLPKRRKTSENVDNDGQAGLPNRESGEMVERHSVQEAERLNKDKQHPPEKAKPEIGDSFTKNVNYKANSQVESSSTTQMNPVEKGAVRADVHQDGHKEVLDHSKMEKSDLKSNQCDIKARQDQENLSDEPQENIRDKTPKQEPTSVKEQGRNQNEGGEPSQIVNTPSPLQEKPDKENNEKIKPQNSPDNNKNSSSCPDVNKSEKDENAKPNKDEGSLPKRRKTSENVDNDGQAGLPTRESGEMVERHSVQEAERLNKDKQHPPEKAKPEIGDSFTKNVNYKANSQVESSSTTQMNPVEKGAVRADVHQDGHKEVLDHSKMEKSDLKSNQCDIKARQGLENLSDEPQENIRDKTPKQEPTSVKEQGRNQNEGGEPSQIVNTPSPLQEKPDKKNNKKIKKKSLRSWFTRKTSKKNKVKQPKVNKKDTNKKDKKGTKSLNCFCTRTED